MKKQTTTCDIIKPVKNVWLLKFIVACLVTTIGVIWGFTATNTQDNTKRINSIEIDVSSVKTKNDGNSEMLKEIRQDIKKLLERKN